MAVSAEAIAKNILQQSIEKAVQKPEWFFNKILRNKQQPWQLRGTNAILDVRRKRRGQKTKTNHKGLQRISVVSCHGTGKTHWLAQIMHLWNFIEYGKIACTAPKEAQLTRRLWPRYRQIRRNAIKEYRDNIEVNAKDIILHGDPDWGAIAETASDPDNLAGYHDAPQLFLVDESSAKRLDLMFPVIEGALTTPGSVLVEIGNPTRTEGEFYNHHCKKIIRDLYYRMHISYKDSPDFISQQWVDTMILKYGIDSPIVQIRVFGKFASFDECILVPLSFIEDALNHDEEDDGSLPFLRVSVDVADGGADSTVVTVARHYDWGMQVLKQKQFYFESSISTIKSAKAALAMFEAFDGDPNNGDHFVVDALGVGAGTAGWLMDNDLPVIAYKGGAGSDDPDRWRNRRVQTHIAMYERFRDGRIRFSENAVDDVDEMAAHIMSVKRNEKNDKVDDIEPKWKLKADSGFSNDRNDSLVMQCIGEIPASMSGDDLEPTELGTVSGHNAYW